MQVLEVLECRPNEIVKVIGRHKVPRGFGYCLDCGSHSAPNYLSDYFDDFIPKLQAEPVWLT